MWHATVRRVAPTGIPSYLWYDLVVLVTRAVRVPRYDQWRTAGAIYGSVLLQGPKGPFGAQGDVTVIVFLGRVEGL